MMYQLGQGIPRDDTQSVYWFRRAAEQGDASAQQSLGDFYCHVQNDCEEAINWYRKSAEQRYVLSEQSLGEMYRYGLGVPKNESESYFWLTLASETSDAVVDERDKVGANLTPAKRLEIQERCRKWMKTHPAMHKLGTGN
jgi:TPR repeat protein